MNGYFNLELHAKPSHYKARLSIKYGGQYTVIMTEETEYGVMDFFRIPYGQYKLEIKRERFKRYTVFFEVTEKGALYEETEIANSENTKLTTYSYTHDIQSQLLKLEVELTRKMD